ncbi:hypothetical protein AB0M42_13405 [Streptomyces sp. NPDC051784]|uniref:hypothetical protein n=1 Tax=Streptomyces sp. NPDC051784 TaxID=3155805 RepID=UPI003422A473
MAARWWPGRRRRPEPEPFPPRGYEPDQLEIYMYGQSRRRAMREEASRIIDDRLDLPRESATWNVATYGTLTTTATGAVVVLALTGPTWWVAAPAAAAVLFARFTLAAVRDLRHTPPRSRRRGD